MATEIAYKLITTAKDEAGKPVKFQTLNRAHIEAKVAEVQGRDPKARFIGIPVGGR